MRIGENPPVIKIVTSGKIAALTAIALFAAATVGWCGSSRQTPPAAVSGQWGQPPSRPSALNPNGFPKAAACQKLALDDPAAEAKANIAKDDLRPFTIYGFTPGDVPGVFCPSGNYELESRGGTFVSDIPDACGARIFSAAAPDQMESYNRTLAADPRFQRVTQCRPSTYCEERYGKGYSAIRKRDPKCPAEPQVLLETARYGTTADLIATLKDFDDRSPRSRDAVTSAFLGALGRAKWDNAEALLSAGADINGRALDTYPDNRKWLGSPLEAVFNQNGDKEGKIVRARWLFAHGLTFTNPLANQALTWAASSNDVDAVIFLLTKGASPNGPMSTELQDALAHGNIQSAGGPGGETPFYTALGQAKLAYVRRTPQEITRADAEQRKGRINAVALYRAGARFSVGRVYDELRRNPDQKIASIVLAAATREGRLTDVIDRILYPNGRERPLDRGKTDGERALVAYLLTVKACPAIRPFPEVDHVKLCATGAI